MNTQEGPVIRKSTLNDLSTKILDFGKAVNKLYWLFFKETITFSEDGNSPTERLEPDYEQGHSKVNFESYINRWDYSISKEDIKNAETEITENILTSARDGNEYAYLSNIDRLVGQWQTVRNTVPSLINQVAELYDLSIDAVSASRLRHASIRSLLLRQFTLTKYYTPKPKKIGYAVHLRKQIICIVNWIHGNYRPARPLLRKYFGHWTLSGERLIPQLNKVEPAPPTNTPELAERALNALYAMLSSIDSITESVRRATNTSIFLVQHPSQFPNLTNVTSQVPSTDQEPELDKGLSAAQKLLFVRLLQEQNLFPKKPNNTDDAPELRAIALLTGLSFENQIKGGKGAAAKVNQLLNDRERINLAPQQAKPKLDDLNAIENVARLLNLESILTRIDQLRKDLNRILEN